MDVLAWHSWQFSAVSRKCYLILPGHESSERSWWPCLGQSVPSATPQPVLLPATTAQSWDVSNVWASCNRTDDSCASFILRLIKVLLPHVQWNSVVDLCILPRSHTSSSCSSTALLSVTSLTDPWPGPGNTLFSYQLPALTALLDLTKGYCHTNRRLPGFSD